MHHITTMYKSLSVILFLLLCQALFSQSKVTTHKNENWTQVYLNVRLAKRWGIAGDVGYRFKNVFESKTQTLVRVAGVYYFNNNVSFSVGISYFRSNPLEGFAVPEIRPHQRLFVNSVKGKFSISQRYRLEERFIRKSLQDSLLEGYRYNYRFGYQLNVQFPIKGKTIEPRKLFVNIYDEIFVNFGKQIVYNQFDQNRIFIGMGYQFTKNANMIIGYQYIWQQTSSGNKFNAIDCARVTFSYNIDARKDN